MEPTIIERESELAIGLAISFCPGTSSDIATLWRSFNQRKDEIPHAKASYSLGVVLSQHSSIEQKSDRDMIYVASLPVMLVQQIPADMISLELPAGRYAVFTHSAPIGDIQKTLTYIWQEWPGIKDARTDAPCFELYDDRFDAITGTGEVEIFVALK